LTVICDSSVLIALSSIDMLNLLQYICKNESLFIPKAVWNEVVTEGKIDQVLLRLQLPVGLK